MSGIEDAIEQDALASTLLSPREQAAEYADRHPEFAHLQQEEAADYRYEPDAEAQDAAEQELDAEADPTTSDEPEVTPAQQAEYMEQAQQWQSLAPETQSALADQYLQEAYGEVFDSLAPKEAQVFCDDFGKEHWGIEGLSQHIDSAAFATLGEYWSTNGLELVSHHPSREELLAAVNDPARSGEALQIAASMVDPTWSQKFTQHFFAATNGIFGDTFEQWTPMQFAAKCLVDLVRSEGWGQQPQRERRGHDSPFATNQDLFDAEAMEMISRRGLL